MLTDVHTHYLTERYVEKARSAGIEHPDGMPGWPAWSVDAHLALMDEVGIGRSLLSISSPGTHFGDDRAARELSRHVNEFAADLARARPDRFGFYGSLPLPDVDGALEETAHSLDVLGADGVCLMTNAQGLYLGHERFEPLWAELDRRRALVFVHPTSPPNAESLVPGQPQPMMEFLFETARCAGDLVLNGVTRRWRGIRWVLTHGAGVLPLLARRTEVFTQDPQVPRELAAFWYDLAGTPFPDQVPVVERIFGTDRLLYGSDSCWTPAEGVRAQVASIDAAPPPGSGGTWRDLTGRNTLTLMARNGS